MTDTNSSFRLRRVLACAALVVGLPVGASAAAERTIDLTYDSTMDMVRPEIHPGIIVHHNLHIVANDQGITEDRDRSYRTNSDTDAMRQQLGEDSGTYVSWSVDGPTKLIRTERDLQSVRTMVITLGPGSPCHLDVNDALLPGSAEFKFSRIGRRGTDPSSSYAYFSSYRTIRTSCQVK